MNNFFVIVLDGVGVGELPDANLYSDEGSNTLLNIAKAIEGLKLPYLEKLGLGKIISLPGIDEVTSPLASYGKMKEVSKGKDSTTGHWELAGLNIRFEFSLFPNGFPNNIVNNFKLLTGCEDVLGNKTASGTEIINELGDEHVHTGFPIIYTSADSVFQIAAHENVIPLDELYRICKITREQVLTDPLKVGRVIARPFVGENGKYTRTTNRKDFSIDPPDKTILDILSDASIDTIGIGKINDLFNYRGIKINENTHSNEEGCKLLLDYSTKAAGSFIFANLVDFDVYFGHRNDPDGFANKLMEFDDFLPNLMANLNDSDALIITADHGNDPTTPGTDHSREYVPVLFYRKAKPAVDLGIRETFSDVANTVGDFFNIKNELAGKSFLNETDYKTR